MKNKSNRSNIMITIISIIMFLLGSLIFFYPTISNYIANKQYEKTIDKYEEIYKEIKQEDLSLEYEEALKYNKSLTGEQVYDPFVPGTGYALPDNYQEVLNISGNGVMGYIEIPKISLKIPIYHGSTEKVLSKGIGHLETSALPIGGIGYNPVLTGHRGLPRAELFTRLDEMKNGDLIYIHVLNDTLAYEVDNIVTVLPEKLSTIGAYKDKDMITLITCTPYGVNTHRLVVQGHRVEYIPEEKDKISTTHVSKLSESFLIRIIGIPLGIIILFIILFIFNKRKVILNKLKKKNNVIMIPEEKIEETSDIKDSKKTIDKKRAVKEKKNNNNKKKKRQQRKKNNDNKKRGSRNVKKN